MKKRQAMIVITILLFLSVLLSLSVGRFKLSLHAIFELLKFEATGRSTIPEIDLARTVFWTVRLPRAVMSVLVGMVLAASGTVFQGLFRNPLVSPDILGVSAGASFGAGVAILFISQSIYAIQSCAFLFGLVAVLGAYTIGRKSGDDSIVNLVLAGVIVSALFTAGLSYFKYVADPYEKLPALVFWTMGGFNTISWDDIVRVLPVVIIGLLVIYHLRWRLNVLSLGEEEALALGVNIKRDSAVFILFSTLMVASCISACGAISWVGLVVPHMARIIVGPDNKTLVPFSVILGGVFMVLMDTVARTISVAEIPISIITSFLGAPFLCYLLLRGKNKQWDS